MGRSLIGGLAWAFLLLLFEFLIVHPNFEIRRSDLMACFIAGLSFGIIIFLTLSIGYILSERKIKKKYGLLESYDPVQSRTMTIHKDYQTVFEKCLESLQAIGAEAVLSSPAEGLIKAKTERSWRSLGESIEVKVSSKETAIIEVVITSKPKISGAVFDYGRGVMNVEELRKAIAEGN